MRSFLCTAALLWCGAVAAAPPEPAPYPAEGAALLAQIRIQGDNRQLPFAILDKRQAQLTVYDARGQQVAASAVLLGLAHGDQSVPGIGERKMADIRPDERTTPAGRFVTEPGRNLQNEDIVWIDYGAAVSMHRVRAVNPSERRLERLASPSPADNRITYGCVNVPAAFYDAYIAPVFGRSAGVVYVLPESEPRWAMAKPPR